VEIIDDMVLEICKILRHVMPCYGRNQRRTRMTDEKDYEDFRVWKEVKSAESHTFQDWETMTPQEVFDVGAALIKKAEAEGLENCSLLFESHYAVYDGDYLGNPSVSAKGYRKLNSDEEAQLKFEDEIDRVSKDKGIFYYQARNLLELKRDGVID
jgi:hypothetical protein